MTKFFCVTESFLQKSIDPLEPPEYSCISAEIEAPNRNKAKWIFIKNNFGTRGSMKSRGLPKISVTIAKPFLVIEQDPSNELEPCLIDGETYDPICMLKFDSLERISKFTEILNRCGVPHSMECLTYFDTDEVNKTKDVGPIEVMHGMLDEMSAPHFSQENCASELLSRFDWLVQYIEKDNKELEAFRSERASNSKLYTEQSQKLFEMESRIAGLVNREKLAAHAANQFEKENRELKTEIRAEIAELLDKEVKNAEVNVSLQEELNHLNDLLKKSNDARNDALEDSLEEICKLKRILEEERESRKEVVRATDSLLNMRQKQIDEILTAHNASQARIKELEIELVDADVQALLALSESRSNLSEAKAKIQELENALATTSDENKQLNDALTQQLNYRIDELDKIRKLEESIKNIGDDRLNRHLVDQKKLDDAYGAIDDLENALDVKETSNQLLQAQLTQAQAEIYYLNDRHRNVGPPT